MSDAATPLLGLLPHLGVLRFSGPDAPAFLQGQLSNDTRPLSEGTSVFGAYSTPQGRVLALIYLLPHATGILGVLPRDLIAETAERLRKFVLRAKVRIEDVSGELQLGGASDGAWLEAHQLPRPPLGGYAERNEIGIAHLWKDASRFLIVAPHSSFEALHVSASAETAWRLADIRAGLPQVYGPTREAFVAQMLNLDLIDGISFTKGCYTGQEIIARTQHLGRIKRRMVRLQLPRGDWRIGQQVNLADGRSGKLTEVVADQAHTHALAVLNVDAVAQSDEAPQAPPIEAHELALPYAS
jgi:folate-binding protein YgfZ